MDRYDVNYMDVCISNNRYESLIYPILNEF